MNRYPDIVAMAESGDAEAYVGPKPTRQVWRREWTAAEMPTNLSNWEQRYWAQHGGWPESVEVLVPPSGGRCYEVTDLMTDEDVREAVKRTAELGRRIASHG
jgi:hypothetical protein